jgi:sigma-E factor negative regulatory protein RseB
LSINAVSSLALLFAGMLAMHLAAAQAQPAWPANESTGEAGEKWTINEWLVRAHQASKKLAYVGTFVVSSGGTMSSARVWHAREGDQQIERVETLSGPPRSVFRHNDQVVTFLQDQKIVRSEKREFSGLFPELLQSTDSRIADFYKMQRDGVERVAGFESDVVVLIPKDALRFAYRVWTEQKRGLVVKLQTVDGLGRVLEQAAFSELELDAPVRMGKLVQMMGQIEGYRVEKPVLVKTVAAAEGWRMRSPVAGFKSTSLYKRPAGVPGAAFGGEALQWIFSDGLASVSIFVEPFDRSRHDREARLSTGATQTMTRQSGVYWLTLVGEVPMTTLALFAESLERTK